VKTLREAKEQAARVYLCEVIRMTRGNLSRAAPIVGVERKHLYKLMRRHSLNVEALLGQGVRRDRGPRRGSVNGAGIFRSNPLLDAGRELQEPPPHPEAAGSHALT
jgi:hypothetical protein